MATDHPAPTSEPVSPSGAGQGAASDGRPGPGEEATDPVAALLPVVYEELRQIALAAMAREADGHTLQATALVNEAYLKLAGGRVPALQGREHFLGVAARAMRQVLVDHARRRGAERRGGGAHPVTLSLVGPGVEVPLDDMLALDRALDELEEQEPRLRQVVEYRYFAGLNDSEIATCLGVTRRTVLRDWARARSWLNRRIYGS